MSIGEGCCDAASSELDECGCLRLLDVRLGRLVGWFLDVGSRFIDWFLDVGSRFLDWFLGVLVSRLLGFLSWFLGFRRRCRADRL